ncbi:GIN domain-containing protein [Leeuwenhoekiella sp. H156]|uniref:GIN domain-containing protein n=1 Tax=Leeuwenhoekiella sp. H156 TaxID=3450128 RepID=UPI003FA46746
MKLQIVFAFALGILTSCSAQKKIKGDKDVISVNGNLTTGINTVEVGEGIELELAQSNINNYVLTTDRNLTSVIQFEVRDSVLRIMPSMRITRSKELHVYLKLQNPQHIILNDDTEFESPGIINVPDFSLTAREDSEFEFKLRSEQTHFNLSGNAKGDVTVSTGKLNVKMNGRTDLQGDFDASESFITLDDNAEFEADGKTKTLNLTSSDRGDYKGRKFEADEASVTLSGRTATAINANDNLTVFAQDKASIESYGKGEISINALKDDAAIEKK